MRRPIGRRSFFAPLLLAAVVSALPALGAPAPPEADGAPPLEYQVKAAFLFNFARFIEWPENGGQAGDTFLMCVLDNEDFARATDVVVGGKTVDGRVLRVRHLQGADDPAACRILFFGSNAAARLRSFLKTPRHDAILTVGDVPGFTRDGGVINFIIQDHRVHFEINPDAAHRAGLRISSKLLQLATIVRDTSSVEEGR